MPRAIAMALVLAALIGCNDSPAVKARRTPQEHLKEKIVELPTIRGDDGSERRSDANRKARDWLRQHPDYVIIDSPWSTEDVRVYKMLVRPKNVSSRPMDDD